jgi:hypothetical protein
MKTFSFLKGKYKIHKSLLEKNVIVLKRRHLQEIIFAAKCKQFYFDNKQTNFLIETK